jgi:hypothetical protein
VGDVLRARNGDLREVVSVDTEDQYIVYVGLGAGDTVTFTNDISRASWASWCCRTRATLAARGVPGYVVEAITKRKAILEA